MAKPPANRSSSREIEQFLQKSKAITQFVAKQPRLLFAVDATASRQPTWDTACHLQQGLDGAPLVVLPGDLLAGQVGAQLAQQPDTMINRKIIIHALDRLARAAIVTFITSSPL